MKEQWTDKIRQSMETLDVKAPDGLLSDIKAEMARRGIAPQPHQRPAARLIPMRVWRSMAGAAAVALIAGVSTWLLAPKNGTLPVAVTPSGTYPTASAAPVGHPASFPLAEKAVKTWRHTLAALGGQTATDERPIATDSTADTQPLLALTEAPATPTSPETQNPPSGKQPARAYRTSSGNRMPAYPPRQHSGSRISMDAYYGGSAGGRAGQPQTPMIQNAPGDLFYHKVEQYVSGAANMRTTETREHHRLPVKVGLSARYHIDDRWSVQAGVTYSYHASDFVTGERMTRQHLHFVGIPVAASYNVWSNRHVNLYLTAGGEIERMVKGKSSMDYNDKTISEDVKMTRPQLSALVAGGAEYKATKLLSVYVEPGAAYHFDNGSDVRTYYNDKPLNFSLNMGVRLNLGQ